MGRMLVFDKRGVGLSDPVSLKELPALEEWADDVLTVMDHARSDRAAVVAVGGVSLGGAAPSACPQFEVVGVARLLDWRRAPVIPARRSGAA